MAETTKADVIAYLKKKGYNTVSTDFYGFIKGWLDWYQAVADDFHKTTFYNGISTVSREMMCLGMAKTVCEIWANLLMNEKVEISVGDERGNEILEEILKANNFRVKANQLCEMYMASGTGAFVEYLADGEVRIDYVSADMIFPLSWDSRGISECAFGSRVRTQAGDGVYLQIHRKEKGTYVIENHMIADELEGESAEMELPEGLAAIVATHSEVPFFQIVTPNIINNVNLRCPMGISVYANAIDCLKELDTAFDALNVEIETGRRMVFLSADLFFTDQNGSMRNVVGNKETVLRFIGDPGDSGEKKLIYDFTPELRINNLKEALQFQLNLLSQKVGMGTNQFEFTPSGAKTATEIISEDSDLYQNLKKHELVLETALIGMVDAIAFLSAEVGRPLPIQETTINFDDSIIEDKKAERQEDRADLANGTLRPEEYRSTWRGETEEEALKNLPDQVGMLE